MERRRAPPRAQTSPERRLWRWPQPREPIAWVQQIDSIHRASITNATIVYLMTTDTTDDPRAPWLLLLQHISSRCPNCIVGGDIKEGLNGMGDIDLLAPERSWTLIPGAKPKAPAKRRVVQAAEGMRTGEWNRRSMLILQAWAIFVAITHLSDLFGRTRARLLQGQYEVARPPVRDHGRVPRDLPAWLERVRKEHRVYEATDRIPTVEKTPR